MTVVAHPVNRPAEVPGERPEEKGGRTDADLVRLVQDELRWDGDLQGAAVGVSADLGSVILTGTVPCHGRKIAAQRAASRVSGVLEVVNEIHVATSPHPLVDDFRTARAVYNALEADSRLAHRDIQSSVQRGVVTLEGYVPTYHLRRCAEQVVEYLNGVRGVVNRLRVASSGARDADTQKSIEEALLRQNPRYANTIAVAVHDGVATLTGAAHSPTERDALLAAAAHAPGIFAIVGRIRIPSVS